MVLAEQLSMADYQYEQRYERRLTQQPRKKSRLMLKLICGLFVLMLINIIVQAMVVQTNHQINTWKNMIREQEREMIQLRVEIAALESFERIQLIAQTELGMKMAGPDDYKFIAAVPSMKKSVPSASYLAKSEVRQNSANLLAKLNNWLGGFGRTMAKTP